MRLLLRPPSEAADPFDPNSFDFVAYVARRHGLERADAESVVQDWLKAYEPSPAARRALAREAPRSGLRHAKPHQDQAEERTGTNG